MAGYKMMVPITARLRDTDAMGHVNNAVYLSYTEAAREVYWAEVMRPRSFKECGFILARMEIDFRSPAFAGEELLVSIRVSRLGASSFDFSYEIREKGSSRLMAEARSIQVMYDYENRASRPMTDPERRAILRFEGEIAP